MNLARMGFAPIGFSAFRTVDRSLHTRVGLVLTALAACCLLFAAGLWLQATRNAIHEEVEAATRVSEQWLKAIAGELQVLPPEARGGHLLGIVRAVGRVRANALTVSTPDGVVQYQSPPPTYKAGRAAPAVFAALLADDLPQRRLALAGNVLVLTPDTSRAVLDAWDDLVAMAGWACLFLVALFLATRHALARALSPLDQVMQALDRTGAGRFDTRLPVFAATELARLSRAFNGMADRLQAAVDDNVRLETAQEVSAQLASRLQARVEAERRAERESIARELHDELAQGITAVRALAGAIVQRSGEQPALHSPAQGIVAVTGEMQEGVRRILHRLRPPAGETLAGRLNTLLDRWRWQQEGVAVAVDLAAARTPLPAPLAEAVLRIVQEGLTNIARHAAARHVELLLTRDGGDLCLQLSDDGQGCDGRPSPAAGCGLGLTGMHERVAQLGGRLDIDTPATGGFRLRAVLPILEEECV